MGKRPLGLLIVICYKTFTATLFALSSISIFLALKNYEGLQNFSEALVLAGKQGIVAFLIEKLSGLSSRTLMFSGVALAIYSFISACEAIGLWFQAEWAKWLVIGIVGISIFPEIYELIQGVSLLKLLVLALNLGIFAYLISDFLRTRGPRRKV
jgi:uncharacterized membrane protein (DUF2068 family)